MDREILYIWLNKVQGIGPILAGKLLGYFGNIIEVYNSNIYDLLKIGGIGEKLAKTIVNKKVMSLDAIKAMLGLNSNKIEELLFNIEINGNIKQVGRLFSKCNC